MSISASTKEILLKLSKKFPQEKRERFIKAIQERSSGLNSEGIMRGALLGGAIGAIMEVIPGVEALTGIDDFVEVGVALGAWVGNTGDNREREERERIKEIIEECIREAYA